MTRKSSDIDGPYHHPILERQILIRFPPDIAERLNKMMENQDAKPSEVCSVTFRDSHHADVIFDGEHLFGFLVSLPTYVESHRTVDQARLYKSGDISEILIVQRDKTTPPSVRDFVLQSGLTPPTADIIFKREERRAGARQKLAEKEEASDLTGIDYWEMVEIQLAALLSKDRTAKPIYRREILDEPDVDPVELEKALRRKFGDMYKGYSGRDIPESELDTPSLDASVHIPQELIRELSKTGESSNEEEQDMDLGIDLDAKSEDESGTNIDDEEFFSEPRKESTDAMDEEESSDDDEEDSYEEEESTEEPSIESLKNDLMAVQVNRRSYEEQMRDANEVTKMKIGSTLERLRERERELQERIEELEAQKNSAL